MDICAPYCQTLSSVDSQKRAKLEAGRTEKRLRVALWCPELVRSFGGIQAYSSAVLTALSQTMGKSQISLRTKNDENGSLARLPVSDCASAGALSPWWRTPGFASLLAYSALKQKPDLIITTHVNSRPWRGS